MPPTPYVNFFGTGVIPTYNAAQNRVDMQILAGQTPDAVTGASAIGGVSGAITFSNGGGVIGALTSLKRAGSGNNESIILRNTAAGGVSLFDIFAGDAQTTLTSTPMLRVFPLGSVDPSFWVTATGGLFSTWGMVTRTSDGHDATWSDPLRGYVAAGATRSFSATSGADAWAGSVVHLQYAAVGKFKVTSTLGGPATGFMQANLETPGIANGCAQFTSGILSSTGVGCGTGTGTGGGVADPGANGFMYRTAVNVSASRTLLGTANHITVANGNGATDPVWDFDTNLDLGTLNSTKPMKRGTTLPVTCAVGDMFFKTDATLGSNLYACLPANNWLVQAGGSNVSIKQNGTLIGSNSTMNILTGDGINTLLANGVTEITVQNNTDNNEMATRAQVQSGQDNFINLTSTGTKDFAGTLLVGITAYPTIRGMVFHLVPNFPCSGAVTMNLHTLGSKRIFEADGLGLCCG
jgi:hypothetical protein